MAMNATLALPVAPLNQLGILKTSTDATPERRPSARRFFDARRVRRDHHPGVAALRPHAGEAEASTPRLPVADARLHGRAGDDADEPVEPDGDVLVRDRVVRARP